MKHRKRSDCVKYLLLRSMLRSMLFRRRYAVWAINLNRHNSVSDAPMEYIVHNLFDKSLDVKHTAHYSLAAVCVHLCMYLAVLFINIM